MFNPWTELVFTSSRSADEAKITELGHLIFHHGRVVTQFAAVILIVACPNCNDCAISDFTQCHHSEGDGQWFVWAPMRRQCRTKKVGTARLDQFTLVFNHGVECWRRRSWMLLRSFWHQDFSWHSNPIDQSCLNKPTKLNINKREETCKMKARRRSSSPRSYQFNCG